VTRRRRRPQGRDGREGPRPGSPGGERTGPGSGKPSAPRGTARIEIRDWLFLAAILIASFVVYIPALDNDFTNWDDNFYVTDNPIMMNPTFDAILRTPVAGNYHPLTMWSLALNFKASRLDPAAYHWTNVWIHVANTALVFFFVWVLSRGRRWTSIAAAALFAVHPMHVESVAWIAERKDVLYSFFYIAGLIAYVLYIDKKRPLWLVAALIAMILSCASKPAAVVFPVTMLAIDWFRKRKLTAAGVWIEKIPFFAVALIDGILTLQVQQMAGALTRHWNQFERLAFAAYGTLMYVAKMFVPIRLSAIYPYPPVGPGVSIGAEYYAALAVAVVLVPLLLVLFRHNRVVLFGLAFYFINIALVLQFFTVGGATMAERYMYIPYIGLFIALAWWLDEPKERVAGPIRAAIAAIIILLIPVCAYATWKRCDVWQNPETLWNDTIAKYPNRIADAYNNRGFHRSFRLGRFEEAIADFDEAIKLNPNIAKFWSNKGQALGMLGRNDEALVAYNRAIELMPQDADYRNNRGAVKIQKGDWQGAIADCSRAIEMNPRQRDAYSNRAFAYSSTGQYDGAIADSRRALELSPDHPQSFIQYGTIGYGLAQTRRYAEAIPALDEAIRRAPPTDARTTTYYVYRSLSRLETGDKAGARADAQEAERRGARLDAAYMKRLAG
jgi:Tfp pilus assembly protein PilF